MSRRITLFASRAIYVGKLLHLGVSFWRREGEKGPCYSVFISQAYNQGEEWKHTDSFGQDDLLLLVTFID